MIKWCVCTLVLWLICHKFMSTLNSPATLRQPRRRRKSDRTTTNSTTTTAKKKKTFKCHIVLRRSYRIADIAANLYWICHHLSLLIGLRLRRTFIYLLFRHSIAFSASYVCVCDCSLARHEKFKFSKLLWICNSSVWLPNKICNNNNGVNSD